MSRHKTSRGREFNMQAFVSARGSTTAVGNTFRNAQGDLLGPGGKVIATAQEITGKVYDKAAGKSSTAQVKINPLEQEVGRKEVVGADGVTRWEVTFADGSVEIQGPAEKTQNLDIDGKANSGFEL